MSCSWMDPFTDSCGSSRAKKWCIHIGFVDLMAATAGLVREPMLEGATFSIGILLITQEELVDWAVSTCQGPVLHVRCFISMFQPVD